MDADFWMRSSASATNTRHVLSAINSHTVCPLELWLLITMMMDLERHWAHMWRELGQCRPGSGSTRPGCLSLILNESAQIDSCAQSCPDDRTHQPSIIDN